MHQRPRYHQGRPRSPGHGGPHPLPCHPQVEVRLGLTCFDLLNLERVPRPAWPPNLQQNVGQLVNGSREAPQHEPQPSQLSRSQLQVFLKFRLGLLWEVPLKKHSADVKLLQLELRRFMPAEPSWAFRHWPFLRPAPLQTPRPCQSSGSTSGREPHSIPHGWSL